MIDLHVHTTESDGGCTPAEVVRLAHQKGLKAIAITDHDTVAGVRKASHAGHKLGVEIVPGVELSAKTERGILHILGYYVQAENPWLQRCLEALREEREDQFHELLEKLQASGVKERIESPNETILRDHGIGAETGAKPGKIIPDSRSPEMRPAHLRLGTKRYWPRPNLFPQQAIQLILAAGGVPVVAHPHSLIRSSHEDWEPVLLKLIDLGIQGIEAYYPAHTPAQTSMFISSAKENGLVVTGGSDFHGRIHRMHGLIHYVDQIGDVPGWKLPYSLLEGLKERLRANRGNVQC